MLRALPCPGTTISLGRAVSGPDGAVRQRLLPQLLRGGTDPLYGKQLRQKRVVDHPIRKKYTRDQIASLMYIAVSKTVLSIENIDTLFKMQREHCSAGTAYDIFCEELEASLSVVFGSKAAQPETVLNDERLLLRSTIFAAVNKMYLDCCFDALRQEQALWSDILPDLA